MKRFIDSVFTARAMPAEDNPIASILEYESTFDRIVGISSIEIKPSPLMSNTIPARASITPAMNIGSPDGTPFLDIIEGISFAIAATPPNRIIIQLPFA